jgi:hypothetical protein
MYNQLPAIPLLMLQRVVENLTPVSEKHLEGAKMHARTPHPRNVEVGRTKIPTGILNV